ncbi:MAG: VOC family protein [Thermoleophilia bacterium]|nr:VOC family protein [Thermoleophilia bacterium]
MPRVIHFEINADEPERAAEFYRSAFGWEIVNWGGPMPYWLATTGPDGEPGINGAIMHRNENLTTVNTIAVTSVDEFLEKVKSAGGSALTEKMTIPGIGYNAYCMDTEGNVFGIMQDDPSAA